MIAAIPTPTAVSTTFRAWAEACWACSSSAASSWSSVPLICPIRRFASLPAAGPAAAARETDAIRSTLSA